MPTCAPDSWVDRLRSAFWTPSARGVTRRRGPLDLAAVDGDERELGGHEHAAGEDQEQRDAEEQPLGHRSALRVRRTGRAATLRAVHGVVVGPSIGVGRHHCTEFPESARAPGTPPPSLGRPRPPPGRGQQEFCHASAPPGNHGAPAPLDEPTPARVRPAPGGSARLLVSRFSYGVTPAWRDRSSSSGGARAWFEWQLARRHQVPDPDLAGLDRVVARPRRTPGSQAWERHASERRAGLGADRQLPALAAAAPDAHPAPGARGDDGVLGAPPPRPRQRRAVPSSTARRYGDAIRAARARHLRGAAPGRDPAPGDADLPRQRGVDEAPPEREPRPRAAGAAHGRPRQPRPRTTSRTPPGS